MKRLGVLLALAALGYFGLQRVPAPAPVEVPVAAIAPRAPAQVREDKPALARALARVAGVPRPMLSAPERREDGDRTYLSFRQLWEGVPVEPYGNVSLTLGPGGKVLEGSSQYLAELVVDPNPRRPETEARLVAREVATRLGARRLTGGLPIVWVSSPGIPAQGKKAYEYSAQGVQIIVDAATLEVLKTRSFRHH